MPAWSQTQAVDVPANQGPFSDNTSYTDYLEGNQFMLTGDWVVYYGAPDKGWRKMTGTGPQAISCSVAGFGKDPANGVPKRCYVPQTPQIATAYPCNPPVMCVADLPCRQGPPQCAPLDLDSRVYFGAGNKFVTKDYLKGQSVACTVANFASNLATGSACYFIPRDYTVQNSTSKPSGGSLLAATEGQTFTVNGDAWTVYYDGLTVNTQSPVITQVNGFGSKTFVCSQKDFASRFGGQRIQGSGSNRCYVDGLNVSVRYPDQSVAHNQLPQQADGRYSKQYGRTTSKDLNQAWVVYQGDVFSSGNWTKISGIGNVTLACNAPTNSSYCYYISRPAPTYGDPAAAGPVTAPSPTPARLVIPASTNIYGNKLSQAVYSKVDDGVMFMVYGNYWTVYYGTLDDGGVQTTGTGPKVFTCGLASFGIDPAHGVSKSCIVPLTEYPDRSSIEAGFVRTGVTQQCAPNGGTCSTPQQNGTYTMYYGYGSDLLSKSITISNGVSLSFACRPETFDAPAAGASGSKACFMLRN
jgi:hypothetical protein